MQSCAALRIENRTWVLQDPANARKRIYKVFDSIEDARGTNEETGHALRGVASVSSNKAIRQSLGSVISNKQAAALEDIDCPKDQGGAPNTSGEKKGKAKKEQTEEQKQQKEVDKGMSSNLERTSNLKSSLFKTFIL